MRIISLIASATEIVHRLGMGEDQVGRSHECDYPEEVLDLPVCSQPRFDVDGTSPQVDKRVRDVFREALSVYRVDAKKLEELQPTHIVTQSQCEVCAVSLRDVQKALAEELSCSPELLSLKSESVQGVLEDIEEVGRFLGDVDRGRQIKKEIWNQMQAIEEKASKANRRPMVGCIEWIEPLMEAGHWMPELVRMAGGEPSFEPVDSPEITWEQLKEADPEVIVVLPCGFDLPRTAAEMHWLTSRPDWPELQAVREGRVYVTDGNQYFNRPGPRLMESLQILAEIIHPELFPARFQGPGWQVYDAHRFNG